MIYGGLQCTRDPDSLHMISNYTTGLIKHHLNNLNYSEPLMCFFIVSLSSNTVDFLFNLI